MKKPINKKMKTWLTSVLSIVGVLGLTFGLVFGFVDFSPKPQQPEQSTQSATSPTNNSYWDEDVSRVDTDWVGSGTEADPWLITSAAELAGLSYSIYNNTKSQYLYDYYYYSDKYFKQTADLDVSAYWWQPIGILYNRSGTSTQRYFSGNYDGNGHTVSGVFTKSGTTSAYSHQGLFGYGQGGSSKIGRAHV